MKNLRKVLAVVLVVCMAFSFMAVASAKFSDDASIKYTEAVGVMTGIGAISGYPDGSFGPAKEVSRAEAAKMVAYVVAGPAIFNSLPVSGKVFTDVPATHWAAKYIEYCYNKSIVSGVGDGSFNPDGKVTGTQLAVMMLRAIGYGKNSEYGGAGWEIAVLQDAFANNIFYGNDAAASYSVPATREEAALYIFNAIKNIEKVAYNKTDDLYTSIGAGKTIASVNFGILTDTGVLTVNASNSTSTTSTVNGHVYNIATPYSLLGHTVKAYYKTAGALGVAYYVADLSTTLSVAPYTTAAAFQTALLNAGVTTYAGNVPSWLNGSTSGNTAAFTLGTTAPAAGTYVIYNGAVTAYVAPDSYTIQQVTAYTAPTATTTGSVTISHLTAAGVLGASASITLQMLGSTTANVVNLYSGIAVGDYVYVDILGAAVTAVTKATTVTGAVSSYNGATYASVIGGVSYAYSAVTDYVTLTDVALATVGTTSRLFVLDKAGAVAGYDAAYTAPSAANIYGVVLAAGYTAGVAADVTNGFVPTYGVATVYLALSDGTKAAYTYTTTSTGDAAAVKAAFNSAMILGGDLASKDVVTFAVAGTKLTAIVKQTDATASVVTAGSAITGVNAKYYTANTVFIYWSSADTTYYTVSAVKGYAATTVSANNAATTAIYDVNGYGVFVYVDSAVAAVTTQSVAFFTSTTYSAVRYNATTLANEYGYTAYVNGVATTLWSASSTIYTVPYTFSAYTLTSGLLTAVSAPTGTAYNYAPITFKDSSVIVANSEQLVYGAAQIITYDSTTGVVTAGGTLAVGANVSYVYTTDAYGVKSIGYIVVETAGTYTTAATVANSTASGVTAATSLVYVNGTTATYAVKITGTATAGATVTIANAVWAANIPVLAGVTRTSNTILTIANGTAMGTGSYVVTFTVTLTANNTPAPTVTVA